MKNISKKRITEDLHVPEKFIGNHRRYIALKCLLFGVCPYCGDCFKINAEKCPRCHRTLIYGKNC